MSFLSGAFRIRHRETGHMTVLPAQRENSDPPDWPGLGREPMIFNHYGRITVPTGIIGLRVISCDPIVPGSRVGTGSRRDGSEAITRGPGNPVTTSRVSLYSSGMGGARDSCDPAGTE